MLFCSRPCEGDEPPPPPPKNIHEECLSFGKNALSEGKSFQEASVIGAPLGEPPPGGRPQKGRVPSCLQVMLLCWDQTGGQLLGLTQPQAGIWATPQPSAPNLPLPEKALVYQTSPSPICSQLSFMPLGIRHWSRYGDEKINYSLSNSPCNWGEAERRRWKRKMEAGNPV